MRAATVARAPQRETHNGCRHHNFKKPRPQFKGLRKERFAANVFSEADVVERESIRPKLGDSCSIGTGEPETLKAQIHSQRRRYQLSLVDAEFRLKLLLFVERRVPVRKLRAQRLETARIYFLICGDSNVYERFGDGRVGQLLWFSH